ncbi:MAG: hypothetical protein AB1894_06960 [Chloroflexota bacterium]
MADITAIFGITIFLGVAYPGLLTAWWLLFPNFIQRTSLRLERTPWACFWLGLGLVLVSMIPAAILISLPFGPAKLLGFILVALVLSLSSLGAAGLAMHMGAALDRRRGSSFSEAGVFLRGTLALELAAAFPLIGWFLVFPLSTITALGAAIFSLLRWMPAEKRQTAPAEPSAGESAAIARPTA